MGAISGINAWLRGAQANFTAQELSGALGDLGTFLPLLVGLVTETGLDLGTTLLFTGVYNIVSGVHFGVPVPVQPMKTISAVALGDVGLTIPEIMAAGLFVSGTVLLLGLTGLIDWFNRVIPGSVVRGIQLGLGVKLAGKGLSYVLFHDAKKDDWRGAWGTEGFVIGLLGLLFLVLSVVPHSRPQPAQRHASEEAAAVPGSGASASSSGTACTGSSTSGGSVQVAVDLDLEPMDKAAAPVKHGLAAAALEAVQEQQQPQECCSGPQLGSRWCVPAALVVVVAGTIATIICNPDVTSHLSIGPSRIELTDFTWRSVWRGIVYAGLPQLPLTTLNSVVAVCRLSRELIPEVDVPPRKMATSVGLMNVVGCWFGAMPSCHGAGGLAAQHKFGARTGYAVVYLGVFKLALALLLGDSLFELLRRFPLPLLGAMLVFAGVELAASARKEAADMYHWTIMLVTAAGCLSRDTAIGFAAGMGAHLLVRLLAAMNPQVHDKHWARTFREGSWQDVLQTSVFQTRLLGSGRRSVHAHSRLAGNRLRAEV